MKLNFKIIEKYGFPKTVSKPDWDDVSNNYTLPNGIELSTLVVCNNEPCEANSLEGFDGFIYIQTKEELDELINMSFEEVLEKIASENEDFDIEEYYKI